MNKRELAKIVDDLSSPSRRKRQDAAHAIAENMIAKPESILDFTGDIFDALERPEAQTRWELLNSLTQVVEGNVKALSDAVDFAEPSLFDEGSSTVRLAAFRFISAMGSQTKALSKKVWPMLEESIQVYHGDSQYREMLAALEEFVSAPIDPDIKKAVVIRIKFDAKNSTLPIIKKLSNDVLNAAKGIKPKKASAKKTPTKATASKGTAAKKAAPKATAKKSTPKSTEKKTTTKASAKKPTTKKATSKPAAKKAAVKKAAKTAAKETVKPTAKKRTAAKTAAKKTTSKKTTHKGSSVKKAAKKTGNGASKKKVSASKKKKK